MCTIIPEQKMYQSWKHHIKETIWAISERCLCFFISTANRQIFQQMRSFLSLIQWLKNGKHVQINGTCHTFTQHLHPSLSIMLFTWVFFSLMIKILTWKICRWDKKPLLNRETAKLPLIGRFIEIARRGSMLATHAMMGFGEDPTKWGHF